MSQSPTGEGEAVEAEPGYLDSWQTLAKRIRDGNAFSGNERNCFFLNTGRDGRRFVDAAWATGLDDAGDGRGLAFGDWDFDGDVDVWMTFRDGKRVRYFENGLAAEAGASVALRVEGDPAQGCSRDGVGARVTVVAAGGLRQVQTARAGEAFLGQSSRWLHFGLPGGAAVERVEVVWPGRRGAEVFAGVQRGGRYELRQGAGRGKWWQAPEWPALAGREPPTQGDGAIRNRLSAPVLLPEAVRYRTVDGEAREAREGPLLVFLWATWCPDCEVQMRAMGEAAAAVRGAGVRVLGLCVDGAAGDPVDGAAVAAHAAEVGFPFEIGLADGALVERLDGLQRAYFYRQPSLPVPSGFLFDPLGYLNVVYKGSFPVEQLVADRGRLGADEEQAMKQSIPFGGRDTRRVFETNPVALARVFLGGGYPADARRHLVGFLAEHGKPVAEGVGEEAKNHNRRMADVLMMLGLADRDEGNFEGALAQFEEAVRYNPLLLPAQIGVGRALQSLGRPREAKAHFLKMRTVDGRIVEVHARLAEVHEALGEWAEAEVCYRRVLDLQPRSIPALNGLTWLLATAPDEAVRDGEQAVAVARVLEGSPVRGHASILDTLAAAYAAAGRFPEAVTKGERAMQLTERAGQAERAAAMRARVERYRKGEAWVQPTPGD